MSSDNKPQPERLRTRALKGGAVLGVGSVFERGLRFVVNMILARLLAPDQFGLMALVLAANGMFEVLTEVGIGQSVIQNKKGDTDSFLSAAWIFGSLRGVSLCLIGLLIAPWVASIYQDASLTPLLRVVSLTMLFNGMANPRLYVLQKQMKFGRYVIIMQGAACFCTLLCLILALVMRNVWALVIGYVAEAGIRSLLSYLLCPFHLNRRIDRESWRELFQYSRSIVGLPIITFMFLQMDIFVMGIVSSKELLGMYSMAVTLASIPVMVFSKVASPMLLPALSETQDHMEVLRSRLVKMTRYLVLAGLPLATLQALFAPFILSVVYGPAYSSVSTAYSLLSLYIIIYLLNCLIVAGYWATGRPQIDRWFSLGRVLIALLCIYPALVSFGAAGAAGTRLLSSLIILALEIAFLPYYLRLPVHRYLSSFKPGVYLSVILSVPIWLVHQFAVPAYGVMILIIIYSAGIIYYLKRYRAGFERITSLRRDP